LGDEGTGEALLGPDLASRAALADPKMSLVDVQWLLGHAHLTTTEIYLQPHEDEVVRRVLEHQHRRAEPPPPPSGSHRPEVLRILFGGDAGG
jgi:hypothetical protein